jgi:hypothetical protein
MRRVCGVTVVSQWCYSDVTVALQWCTASSCHTQMLQIRIVTVVVGMQTAAGRVKFELVAL